MEYAIAAIIIAVLGFAVWIGTRSERFGVWKKEAQDAREAAKRRKRGDEIMGESTEEDSWLARARKRLARVRRDSRPD